VSDATDMLGNPLAPQTTIVREWAVRVDGSMGGVPGPHVIPCGAQEQLAEARLGWWRSHHPEANATLLRREVVTTRGEWEE
jgi:hypothetical protein